MRNRALDSPTDNRAFVSVAMRSWHEALLPTTASERSLGTFPPAHPLEKTHEGGVLRIGASLVHRNTRKVESPTGIHHLRLKELELLLHLFQHATVTFTREELLQKVWNYQAGLLTRTVDQTMATLRKKIEVTPEQPRVLQTVYGVGYRLIPV